MGTFHQSAAHPRTLRIATFITSSCSHLLLTKMSSNGETVPEGTKEVTSQAGKGKGKAIEQPQAMEEDEESEEESGPEEQPEPEEEDEDMEEIDPDNIIQ